MSRVAASIGYVSLDHVVALNRPLQPAVTSVVTRRHTPAQGRLGGCAANIAAGLAAAGVEVELISWVGADHLAARVLDELQSARVATEGVERDAMMRTAVTWLPYAPGGESYCIYDPGGPPAEALSARQRELCAKLSWVAVAVGPPGACAEALELLPLSAFVLWSIKADPASFPPILAARLARRADVIVHSSDERTFLFDALGRGWQERTRTDALVVETLGARGVRYRHRGAERRVDASPPLAAPDAIGAGDRFCAALLASLIRGFDADTAVRAGVESAGRLLRSRLEEETCASVGWR